MANNFASNTCLSFNFTYPVMVCPLELLILDAILFKRDVLPAPDAPMMKHVCPGRANPVQFFKIYKFLVSPYPFFFSILFVLTLTA